MISLLHEELTMITEKRQFGNLGEKIAEGYLIKRGYLILERNFRTKLGELDIIALKLGNREILDRIRKFLNNNGEMGKWNKEIENKIVNKNAKLVFVEVKSGMRRENDNVSPRPFCEKGGVSRETFNKDMRPEEHVDYWKQKHLIRAAQSYLAYRKLPLDINWQIDVVAVDIDKINKRAKLRHIQRAVTF